MERPLRRPNKNEDEDDLLKQMESFNKSQSSVSVVKTTSKVAESRKRTHDETTSSQTPEVSGNIINAVVLEKDTPTVAPTVPSLASAGAFPEILKWDKAIGSKTETKRDGTRKKVSIFAQQVASKGQCASTSSSSNTKPSVRATHREWGAQSTMLSGSKVIGSKDQEDIHLGNVNILNSMSEEQIIKDRQELLQTLDPSIVEFLKRKKDSKPCAKAAPEMAAASSCAGFSRDVEMTELPLKDAPKELELLKKCKIEREKMEWMRDLDDDETDTEQPNSFSARFDFNGKLMPFKADEIPVNVGLHHHGEEPNRPGYTLEELLTLARSTYPQQRTVAFSTLSQIILNFKQGRYDECFSTNVFDQLLKADVVTLLRLALDDSHNSAVVLDAALECLAQIVDNDVEEAALDAQFFIGQDGHIQPSLATAISRDKDFKSEQKELKDVQILNADLVLGLLRTDVLDRLAYLIHVIKPNSVKSVLNMLRIVTRLARHSLDVAFKIAHHDKLMPGIVQHFLPRKPASGQSDGLYGSPVHQALKVVRVLMSWGKGITTELLEKFDLGPTLLCYLSIEPSDGVAPMHEALRLTIEAARTWITCLKYGHLSDQFVTYHPILMRQLLYLQTKITMNDVSASQKFNFHFGTAIMEVIRSTVCCIPCHLDPFTFVDRDAISTALDWSQFTGILELVEYCLKKWIVELSRNNAEQTQPFCLQLLSATLRLFATFVRRHSVSDAFDPTTFPSKLEEIVQFVNGKLRCSAFFSEAFQNAEKLSIFNDSLKDGRLRDPENVPTLGVVKYQGDIAGSLRDPSPFGLLTSYFDFLRAGLQVNKGVLDSSAEDFNQIVDGLKPYLLMFSKNKRTRSNWFSKPELTMVYEIIKVNEFKKFLAPKHAWKVAVALADHLQVGQDFQLRSLFRKVIFNETYLDPTEIALATLSQMNLSDNLRDGEEVQSHDAKSTPIDRSTLDNLCALYEDLILVEKNVAKSESVMNMACYSITSQTQNTNGETVLPSDWQYLPLVTLMDRKKDGQTSNEDDIQGIRRCLLWVFVTTVYSRDASNETLTNFSASLRMSRLSTVFLAASDLFLDPTIHKLTKMCMFDTLTRAKLSIKFEDKKIPGIDSFEEFYMELLSQFESVSYGDKLFALMILIPLTSRNQWKYRIRLWADHRESLRSITLKVSHLPPSLKVEDFVVPEENTDLIGMYLGALISQSITRQSNELLYKIAVENIKVSVKNATNPRSDVEKSLNLLKEKNVSTYSEIMN